ncbi:MULTISPECIES: hypothetical protein [Sphingomonas]|uniref:hypothetical protein n=1 Tax=Sphingomonas TaxID=13687 RepID=UPI000DEFE396|nr:MULTISPECIES: hypothetical protein [Sphingomonas]
MRCFSCSSVDGSSEYVFCEDEEHASQLFGVFIVVAKLRCSSFYLQEITVSTVPSSERSYLEKALSHEVHGFGSFVRGEGWSIQPCERRFDELSSVDVGDEQ